MNMGTLGSGYYDPKSEYPIAQMNDKELFRLRLKF